MNEPEVKEKGKKKATQKPIKPPIRKVESHDESLEAEEVNTNLMQVTEQNMLLFFVLQ
jgi:hypothetical protein